MSEHSNPPRDTDRPAKPADKTATDERKGKALRGFENREKGGAEEDKPDPQKGL